jgi:predicted chitinase
MKETRGCFFLFPPLFLIRCHPDGTVCLTINTKSAIFLSAIRSALSRGMLGNDTDLTFDAYFYTKRVTCYITGKAELRTVNVAVAEVFAFSQNSN